MGGGASASAATHVVQVRPSKAPLAKSPSGNSDASSNYSGSLTEAFRSFQEVPELEKLLEVPKKRLVTLQ